MTMTRQEIERSFRWALNAAIAAARAGGLEGDAIGWNLRSLASEVGKEWKAEGDRHNEQWKAENEARAEAAAKVVRNAI